MKKVRIFRFGKWIVLSCFLAISLSSFATTPNVPTKKSGLNIKSIIFGHIKDSYEWHVTTIGKTKVVIPLPVIIRDVNTGKWSVFSSSQLEDLEDGDAHYGNFYQAKDGPYEGKLVEKNSTGKEVRPVDLSLTKDALSIIISSVLLCLIILSCGRWAKRNPNKAPGGFIGFMEMFIMDMNDNIIKPCVGPQYKKFAPYLQVAFFFIFLNNLMGLIPIFPAGANVTGNITITFFMAVCTFLLTNLFGNKAYWKSVFWPDVPLAIKPLMIIIELFGVFTKPFALMIRLFANMMGGHIIILSLVSIIFITAGISAALCTSMTFVSVIFSIFMLLIDVLVSWIQALVFTMLSSVFIGLAVAEPEKVKVENK